MNSNLNAVLPVNMEKGLSEELANAGCNNKVSPTCIMAQ
jgi:hypothetical protein